jgi:hypothetical protein
MGRANIYLPDELERRVKAVRIPISEVCQRALLAAVEAAESEGRFDEAAQEQLRLGQAAGEAWAAAATAGDLLTIVREQRFEVIPAEALPEDQYALSAEQSLAWEAGFALAARAAASAAVGSAQRRATTPSAESDLAGSPVVSVELAKQSVASELGDDSGCQIGVTIDGAPACFDPLNALHTGKSPVFAIIGDADLRARFTLSLAQDAAARGTAVVMLDVAGQLTARAARLGKNVRVVRAAHPTMPALDDLTRGAVGLGGLWDMLSGLSASSGLNELLGGSSHQLPPPGHITIIEIAGDGGLASAISAMHAAQLLARLATPVDHPWLVQVDLPNPLTVPGPFAAQIKRVIQAARDHDAALGVSAESAQLVSDLSGNGAMLSTVFAFPTSNPAEADRLRDLLGPSARILINPPGTAPAADEQSWVVMRDLNGRLGQVHLDLG